jgi:hypothetical protein
MQTPFQPKNTWEEITGELGQRFEISFNSWLKPFACGIVIHPSIDVPAPSCAPRA